MYFSYILPNQTFLSEEKSVKSQTSKFQCEKKNVNASMNFTIIMNIILFNLCVNRNM